MMTKVLASGRQHMSFFPCWCACMQSMEVAVHQSEDAW